MSRFDITKTNIAVERLIETTDNPRHLYLLHAYNRHRYLEMAGRWEEIFAPEMTVEKPVYHFNMYGKLLTLDGAEAVQAVYREWTRVGQSVFYTDDEQLAVSDNMVISRSTMYQQTPGSVLAEDGAPVDPDAMYLVKSAEYMIWPYDEKGRLVGEDVWEYRRDGPRDHPARPRRCADRRAGRQAARSAHQAAARLQPVYRVTKQHCPIDAASKRRRCHRAEGPRPNQHPADTATKDSNDQEFQDFPRPAAGDHRRRKRHRTRNGARLRAARRRGRPFRYQPRCRETNRGDDRRGRRHRARLSTRRCR